MKSLALVCVLVASSFAQSNGTNAASVTPVTGESWLNHLHRAFEETSMGKTGRLGPADSTNVDDVSDWQPQLTNSTNHTVTLHGSDLYRLNCWGCHGESGLGAPPEINSVINPTRAMSTQLVIERMRSRGMDISRADAAELAKQSKIALLERLHKGGTDMPAFPHLTEPEVQAILGYLKQLAELPGAENQQLTVTESRMRVGEHVVKSTCHICHSATGTNPTSAQLFNGVIPPLSTLTTRTSLSGFERKVKSGAPILMGAPASVYRGRMPVFYYLSADEVADAYMYLKSYPPVSTAPEPVIADAEPNRASSRFLPVALSIETTNVAPPPNARDLPMLLFQITAGTLAGALLVGGFWFTWREIKRLTALSHVSPKASTGAESAPLVTKSISEKLHTMPHQQKPVALNGEDDVEAHKQDNDLPFHHEDYRRFEESWLARWIEGEQEAA